MKKVLMLEFDNNCNVIIVLRESRLGSICSGCTYQIIDDEYNCNLKAMPPYMSLDYVKYDICFSIEKSIGILTKGKVSDYMNRNVHIKLIANLSNYIVKYITKHETGRKTNIHEVRY